MKTILLLAGLRITPFGAVEHAYIAEEKLTFGLGGDSGGPEGEKAGALEFRKLKISL